MRAQTTYLSATDGQSLFVRTWLPDATGQVRAVVQLVHGMAEHSGRYERFARALTDAGYVVVADDHRGHGRTVSTQLPHGHTGDEDGWDRVVEDISTVRAMIQARWPDQPVILMGHSWGSLLVRSWVARQGQACAPDADAAAGGQPLAGLVIMGTAGHPGLLGHVGVRLAAVVARVRGPQHASRFLEAQGFGGYNRDWEPVRTESDWLSRDSAEVDAYIADPLAGVRCSAAFYRDLAAGALAVNSPAAFAAVPVSLPVLVVSGQCDPVGGRGQGVRQVAESLAGAGVRHVSVRLYPGARHELLNELNRDEVTADLLAWVEARVEDRLARSPRGGAGVQEAQEGPA